MKLGWLLQIISVGTTASKSMNAAQNILLGQTEACLMIKPYLKNMTKSEHHAVITERFAKIAGIYSFGWMCVCVRWCGD